MFPSHSPWLIQCGFNGLPATAEAVVAMVDSVRQCFASAALLSESVPSDNTMGTVLPTEALSAFLYTVRAFYFGLVGLLEGGRQRVSERVIGRVVDAEEACCMLSRLPCRFGSCSLTSCSSCSQVCLPGCRRFSSVINNLARESCVVADLNLEIKK